MSEQDELTKVLVDLKALLTKQTSLRFAFFRGILYGLGTVVGATILIGIFTWLTSVFFADPTEAPIIGPALEEAQQ